MESLNKFILHQHYCLTLNSSLFVCFNNQQKFVHEYHKIVLLILLNVINKKYYFIYI